jgi:hypothetical protein
MTGLCRLIEVKGNAKHVSREQVRAFLYASFSVLAFHSRPPRMALAVRVKPLNVHGQYFRGMNRIELDADNSPEDMLTTCLHEMIHACLTFPEGTDEKCTSTLCARLKPDVAALAAILVKGTYKRAAYLAHTKLSYVARDGDRYDPAEDDPIGVIPHYHK